MTDPSIRRVGPEPAGAGPAPSLSGTTGVVLMAYGTPRTPADIEPFYTHIRRGRRPGPQQLADLTARYEAIGGLSPLAIRTEQQLTAIQEALARRAGGDAFRVVLGQRHAEPFIEDGVSELRRTQVDRIIGLVLSPHFSRLGVGQYHERARASVGSVPYLGVSHWYQLPAFQDFLVEAIQRSRAGLPQAHKVLFTAHSLPESALVDDPYPDQLRAGASAVAARIGLDRWAGWSVCWQSAGSTGEPWRGPDITDTIIELVGTGRSEGILVCPHGFAADHLEVLYDLDIRAAAIAEEAGLAFARTDVVNADPAVMDALAELILVTTASNTGHSSYQ